MTSTPSTRPGSGSVDAFLDAVADPGRREDARAVLAMMREASGCDPVMWGSSIVGFGSYRAGGGRGGGNPWPLIGFSPRKQALALYIMPGFEAYAGLMARLGPHTTGKSCLYIRRLADVDIDVLADLMRRAVADMRERHPE